jgi:hypothetical protein
MCILERLISGIVNTGSVVASLISWNSTHSLGWTILHLEGSWIYVLYAWGQGRLHW